MDHVDPPAQLSLVVLRDSIRGRLDAAMLEAFLQTELLQQSSGMVIVWSYR